jgi:hypothetical protein
MELKWAIHKHEDSAFFQPFRECLDFFYPPRQQNCCKVIPLLMGVNCLTDAYTYVAYERMRVVCILSGKLWAT